MEPQVAASTTPIPKPQTTPSTPSTPRRIGRQIVVFSTKGGVGKTVVSLNLAVALAQQIRKPVCVVDLDVMAPGDAAKMLRLNPEHSVAELATHIKAHPTLTQLPIEGIITSHTSANVHLVQCLSDPHDVQKLSSRLLQLLFATLTARYEYVIVDAGKGITDPLITAFDEANLILLVTTPDIVSLYQTKWAMNIIESLMFPPNMVKAILNRAESRGGVGSQDARLAMPCEFIGTIPSDGRTVGLAVNQGVPVVTLHGVSKIAEAFRNLAEVLVTGPNIFLSHQDLPRRHTSMAQESSRAVTDVSSSLARFYAQEDSVRQESDEIIDLKQRVHRQLVEELDLKSMNITLLSQASHQQEVRDRCQRIVSNLLSRELGGIVSSHEVRTRLVKEITDEALGLGPLEELLHDPSVNDILVNGKDQIYVERRGRMELTSKRFISDDQVRAVIERIIGPLGRRIDESNPMVDARLPDGSRVNAIIPPLAVKGPTLSIRKFGHIHLHEDELIRLKSLTADMAYFLKACVLTKKDIVISGGTGSGKTTLLNVICSFIPQGERIISIEDAVELRLPQIHWVCLEARPANVEGKGQISIRDLFRNVLRMRPDRVIIGECRGAETLDMLQAMNTGHDGSITTVHANSPKDVISRMDSMVLMSNVELPLRTIREMVASAVHLVIHTARLSDGARKIVSISEIVGIVNETEIRFQELFRFQQTGVAPDGTVEGRFVACGHEPTFMHEFKIKGIDVDPAIFRATPGVETSTAATLTA